MITADDMPNIHMVVSPASRVPHATTTLTPVSRTSDGRLAAAILAGPFRLQIDCQHISTIRCLQSIFRSYNRLACVSWLVVGSSGLHRDRSDPKYEYDLLLVISLSLRWCLIETSMHHPGLGTGLQTAVQPYQGNLGAEFWRESN
jgi:hypothetical protein